MSFLKIFLKDSLVYTLPTLISQGLAILLVPIYTRILLPADYGILDLLLAFGAFINLSIAFEISQGNAWYYIHAETAGEKKKYASTAFTFTLICYAIFLVAGLAMAPSISEALLGGAGNQSIFRLAVIYIWLSGIFNFLQNQLRWEMRSKDYTAASLVVAILTPIFALSFAYGLNLDLYGLLLGMAIGMGLAVLYSFSKLFRSLDLYIYKKHLHDMLRYSLPLVPSSVAVFTSYYIDRLMLRHYMTLEDVGLYGVAFRLASVVGLLIVGFRVALTPLILARHKEPETPGHIAFILRIFIIFALLLSLGLSIFAEEIFWIMTTPDFYPAAKIVPFLVPAVLLSSMYIFAPGIDIVKKTHITLYITLSVAVLNIILNWFLIPRYGTVGAALSTLLGAAVMFLSYITLSQKFYPVPHQWKKYIPAIFLAVVLMYLGNNLDLNIALEIFVKLGFIILALAFIVLTNLVSREEIDRGIRFFKARMQIKKSEQIT